jgi:hypothetical protein
LKELDRPGHYFAGGRRIPLEADPDHVGVDLRHPAARALPAGLRSRIEKDGTTLRAGVFLVDAGLLSEAQRESLDDAGALLPAFRSEGATLVVLPEVRVEYADEKQHDLLRRRLAEPDVDPDSVDDRPGRVSFAPGSGRAADAMRLANQLYEELDRPPASQARFLRVVPRGR